MKKTSSQNETEIGLKIYKIHYVLIKKLHIFIGNSKCKFICRKCLSCFEYEHALKKYKERCEQQDFTAIRLSIDKHLAWKKHYQKVPLFTVYADFECNNEIDNSTISEKTTNINRQNLYCNRYCIVSDLPEVLASEYKYVFGHDKVDWFVDEIIKLENKMKLYFKDTNIPLKMSEEVDYNFENSNKCWFCELDFDENEKKNLEIIFI